MLAKLQEFGKQLEGDFYTDKTLRTLYATDASVYREMPLAVARPKNKEDLLKLVRFANENKTSLIPRTAGTSLGGQVVGNGIIVDVSKYFTEVIEVNKEEKWVRVQPGVVRDELNKHLKQYGLFFAPETSTSNRCMVGGMAGNNSCGSHSVIYGTTRDHLLELETILSDGSEVKFGPITSEEFQSKCNAIGREGEVYSHIHSVLSDEKNKAEIVKEFPKPEINRRNTGYAIDVLLKAEEFGGQEKFNFCKLLAGSEGTLAFTTELKLNLVDLPPKVVAVVAVHCQTLEESFEANLIALKYKPGAVELIDKIILDCTKENIEQQQNRFFVEGDPGSLLVVEFARDTHEEILEIAAAMEAEMRSQGYGYHFPILYEGDVTKVWNLRKAGLGLLANIPGDPKAVACIEDTAVAPADLPAYMRDFKKITDKYQKECVYYAHIGDGEIHLRPVLDLKDKTDRELFFKITDEVADLVKQYKGSMSGEHGDGRVRGEFVRKMVGDSNYKLIESVKTTWDPDNIFNPGKIVDTPKMNEFLRYEEGQKTPNIPTLFDFGQTEGVLRMAEKCNGSGDCRKTHLSGGTMCPSYMATKNEKDTTRARANILREFLTNSEKANRFDHEEIKDVLDLCLSCKGCKSECPSNVDMAMLKSEFLYNYQKEHGTPRRSKMIATVAKTNQKFSGMPWLYNFGGTFPLTAPLVKGFMGISQKRSLPTMYKTTLRKWAQKHHEELKAKGPLKKKIYFFADEVINFNDVEIGIKAIKLLSRLGYEIEIPKHAESGRPAISKGVIDYAQELANENVQTLKDIVNSENPIVGIEPSAILTFRDEYPNLVKPELKEASLKLAKNALLIDEFIAEEFKKGNIDSALFTDTNKVIKLHGHCHQKALSSVSVSETILKIPANYNVETIPSGCCGMSGSFGYEKEHYDVSMQIGELVLFPAVREASAETVIAAPGTSCRHQIYDGTKRKALHPVEVLFDALTQTKAE